MEISKPQISYILLAICTYKRPNMLKNVINSIKDLILPHNIKVEVLVVDNDAGASAKKTFEECCKNIELKMHYFVEEKRGLASARNRVLEEAINLNASHIFMFDDDEILTPDALVAHTNLYQNDKDCFISSGIVLNKFSPDIPEYIQKNIVFKQKTTKKTGQIKSSCASGNVFIPTEIVKLNDLRFSTEFQLMGGEDGDFFARASRLGYIIMQNNDSLIYEDVSQARASIKYILKRSYYNGYSGSFLRFKGTVNHKNKLFYVLKLLLVLLINIVVLIPSIVFGLTVFVNILSMILKTYGKIVGALKKSPLMFYKNIYGN